MVQGQDFWSVARPQISMSCIHGGTDEFRDHNPVGLVLGRMQHVPICQRDPLQHLSWP